MKFRKGESPSAMKRCSVDSLHLGSLWTLDRFNVTVAHHEHPLAFDLEPVLGDVTHVLGSGPAGGWSRPGGGGYPKNTCQTLQKTKVIQLSSVWLVVCNFRNDTP